MADTNRISPVPLATVAKIAGARIVGDPPADCTVAGIGLNSQELPPQAVFAALPGTRTHGARYARGTDAVAILTDAAGAEVLAQESEQRPVLVVDDVRAVLGPVSAEIYGHPSRHMCVIGITGTSGKTTCSYLIEAGLLAAGHRVGLIGTTGTRINGQPVPSHLTTPEAPDLQALFARMRAEGVTHVVMEVSSHAISLGRVAGTHYDCTAFTNLSQDHLDFHPTMEDYFQVKAELFDVRSPLAPLSTVVCTDDDWGYRMAQLAKRPTTVATQGQQATLRATDLEVRLDGAQDFVISLPDGHRLPVHLPLPGEFNVANATIAIGCAGVVGNIDLRAFVRGIGAVAVPGRMEKIDEGQDFVAVVDYAHKPAAVGAVLKALREQTSGRVGVVLGAGGDRDQAKRPLMGQEAARGADFVIITDDNPRSEDPRVIRAAVRAGAEDASAAKPEPVEIREIGDRAAAIDALVEWAAPGDAVVVAGKGHETGQLIAGVTHHFDDREELRRALRVIRRVDVANPDGEASESGAVTNPRKEDA